MNTDIQLIKRQSCHHIETIKSIDWFLYDDNFDVKWIKYLYFYRLPLRRFSVNHLNGISEYHPRSFYSIMTSFLAE